ncbi:helix-turn-helix domain-containing protein [Bythopirellula polymerisocia]|uniref:Bacterial regulatory protein, luxR family n=1 Tax=Bythopirellula polymerisocia TaxID=2528003 RepID=A0A5C6CJ44_9BACT|nr:helix-turn-helix transcriptional regulator [Bythopirellula polymerisocia]TWU24610.1 Bacterial regulatory protein, luxR family [Bythopirellula polymerisocia]
MSHLPLATVEEMIALVSAAGNPTCETSIESCRRALLAGLARLVRADFWVWSIAINSRAILGDAMTTHTVDGGWESEEKPAAFDSIMSDPRFRFAETRAIESCSERHVTHHQGILKTVAERKQFMETWKPIGISHLLLSGYPVGETIVNFFAFYRSSQRLDFDERDNMIVHSIVGQVNWLHSFRSVQPPNSKVIKLAPREREVLVFLLGGDSIKSIACKMGLSHHTIGDYVKAIYRKHSVRSRAELLSHFIGK